MANAIFVNGETIKTELLENDYPRIEKDGFIPIRDNEGKLLFCFHPIFNEIEIRHRGKSIRVPLSQFQESVFLKSYRQSATSAVQQAANHGGRTHE